MLKIGNYWKLDIKNEPVLSDKTLTFVPGMLPVIDVNTGKLGGIYDKDMLWNGIPIIEKESTNDEICVSYNDLNKLLFKTNTPFIYCSQEFKLQGTSIYPNRIYVKESDVIKYSSYSYNYNLPANFEHELNYGRWNGERIFGYPKSRLTEEEWLKYGYYKCNAKQKHYDSSLVIPIIDDTDEMPKFANIDDILLDQHKIVAWSKQNGFYVESGKSRGRHIKIPGFPEMNKGVNFVCKKDSFKFILPQKYINFFKVKKGLVEFTKAGIQVDMKNLTWNKLPEPVPCGENYLISKKHLKFFINEKDAQDFDISKSKLVHVFLNGKLLPEKMYKKDGLIQIEEGTSEERRMNLFKHYNRILPDGWAKMTSDELEKWNQFENMKEAGWLSSSDLKKDYEAVLGWQLGNKVTEAMELFAENVSFQYKTLYKPYSIGELFEHFDAEKILDKICPGLVKLFLMLGNNAHGASKLLVNQF